MGEKEVMKGDQEGKEKKGGGGGDGDAGKKEEAVVLKVDMHCEGCARKIKKAVRGFEGVESVSADLESNKLTVIGKVDPWRIRDRVEEKTRKKVELLSPKGPPSAKNAGGGDAKETKKSDADKKTKEAAATVVLKIRLHCDGCIDRIRKTILKVRGVESVSVDSAKDLVTVKGTMDPRSLPEVLKEKLKRSVEIVPAKGEGGGDDGGEKREKGGDGGGKGNKKDKDGGGGVDGDGGKKIDVAGVLPPSVVESFSNKMDYYAPYGYRVEMVHPPQLFSDENPNACSVM